jgi:hypothetical protein
VDTLFKGEKEETEEKQVQKACENEGDTRYNRQQGRRN